MALIRRNVATTMKRLILLTSLFLTLSFFLAGCGKSDPSAAVPTEAHIARSKSAENLIPAADVNSANRYFFNVNGHSKEEVQKLLNRAQEIYDSLPEDQKRTLEIVLVMHGPDAQFFTKQSYEQNKSLVDSAAKLEAFGFIDLKVCAASARSQGIAEDGFPAFIEVVPYGPDELRALNQQGYTEL